MVVPLVLGTLGGGWVVARWRLRVRGVLWLGFASSTAGAIACLGILAYCPTPPVAGLNAAFPSIHCSAHCACPRASLELVCDEATGLSYASPCFAACTHFNATNGAYVGCGCAEGRSLRPDTCKTSFCKSRRLTFLGLRQMYLSMCVRVVDAGFWILICLMYGVSGIPCLQSLLRSVPHQQRTLALGILLVPIRLGSTGLVLPCHSVDGVDG